MYRNQRVTTFALKDISANKLYRADTMPKGKTTQLNGIKNCSSFRNK